MTGSARMSQPRTTILLALFAFAIAGCALLHMRAWIRPSFVPVDFSPFYCAGKVVLMRQDPYRVEPLRSCEANLGRAVSLTKEQVRASLVAPAPLPGYDFLPLAALALLPFYTAKLMFGALLLGFVVMTGVCLARLSPLPLVAATAVAYLATGYESTQLGQISPIAISLVAVAALAVRRGRTVLAAGALSCAMIQPQIAAFPIIAMFLLVPKVRLPLVLLLSALGIASLGAIGVKGNLEYLQILPLHSSTQVLSGTQYSLTGLLGTIGFAPRIALMLGTIWSFVALGLVIAILSRHRDYAAKSGAIIMIPAAFAALGGTFIHATQVAVALLAAVTFVRPTRGWVLPSLALGVLVVPFAEIPYTHLGFQTFLVYGLALVCSWLVIFLLSDSGQARKRATIIAAVLGLYVVSMAALRPPVYHVKDLGALTEGPQMFASAADLRSSEIFNAANVTPRYRVYYLLLRLPTWIALVVVAVSSSSFFLRSGRRDALATVEPAPLAAVA